MPPEKRMIVKGTAPLALDSYVKARFPGRYAEWKAALPPESRKYYDAAVMAFEEYPLYDGIVGPTQIVCDLFFGGDERGAFESGKFSASLALKGFYKIFFKFGSPQFIIDRSARVFSNYYPEGEMRVAGSSSGRCVLQIVRFPEPYRLLEVNIGGWVEGALELLGKQGSVQVTRSMAMGDPLTEYVATWK
ncbi:MAG: hypothetical protein QUS35_09080 [bacterium]|nr:hypothetical protein [bacterium]